VPKQHTCYTCDSHAAIWRARRSGEFYCAECVAAECPCCAGEAYRGSFMVRCHGRCGLTLRLAEPTSRTVYSDPPH
jgi:hypothetical protein